MDVLYPLILLLGEYILNSSKLKQISLQKIRVTPHKTLGGCFVVCWIIMTCRFDFFPPARELGMSLWFRAQTLCIFRPHQTSVIQKTLEVTHLVDSPFPKGKELVTMRHHT